MRPSRRPWSAWSCGERSRAVLIPAPTRSPVSPLRHRGYIPLRPYWPGISAGITEKACDARLALIARTACPSRGSVAVRRIAGPISEADELRSSKPDYAPSLELARYYALRARCSRRPPAAYARTGAWRRPPGQLRSGDPRSRRDWLSSNRGPGVPLHRLFHAAHPRGSQAGQRGRAEPREKMARTSSQGAAKRRGTGGDRAIGSGRGPQVRAGRRQSRPSGVDGPLRASRNRPANA